VRRQRILSALAVEVRQHLAAVLVHAERVRGTGETDPFEVVQERVHRRRPRPRVTPDGVA
jgi:hypothetical protein